jgi:hypothetical protein
MDAESKPSLSNLARLKRAEEAEAKAWRRAAALEDSDE